MKANTPAHRAAAAKLAAAKAERDRLVYTRAQSPNAGQYSPVVARAEMDVVRCEIALSGTAEQFNRTASDLEGVRDFLLVELAAAREALDVQAPPEPAPLAEPTPEALTAQVNAVLAHGIAHQEYASSIKHAWPRLSLAYTFAREAQALIFAARKAAKEPDPTSVVPNNGLLDFGAPGSILDIDRAIAAIEAQRQPTQRGNGFSALELKLRDLTAGLADYEAAEAKAEKTRVGAAGSARAIVASRTGPEGMIMTTTKASKATTLQETISFGLATPTRSKPGDGRDEEALTQLRDFLSHTVRPDKVRAARSDHRAAQLEAFRVGLPGKVPDTDESIAAAARDFIRASERCAWREG